MAYMNQERKAKIAPTVKAICNAYGMKGTLSVHNHSTLHLTLKSGEIDFRRYFIGQGEYTGNVNTYWIDSNFSGVAQDFLNEVRTAMNTGNHDNSDIMTDYFDVGWYVNISIGRWDKPYLYTGS